MRVYFFLTTVSLNVFVASYALPPRLPMANLSRNNLTLIPRQGNGQSCSCSTIASGCSGCSADQICCLAGDVCYDIGSQQGPIFNQDACCTGNACNGAAPPPSSSSATDTATSTPPPTSTTPIPSSTSSTPTAESSTTPGSESPAPTAPVAAHSEPKTGAIVGGAVGGAAAVGAGILAFFTAEHLGYIFGVLAAALLGLFIFRSRRLVFSVDEDVGQTQISLFLTPHKKLVDTALDATEKILVWKVFDIGHAQRHFDITVPCTYGEGIPEIGFGTIEDKETYVRCSDFSPAPTYLDEEGWHLDDEKEKEPAPETKPKKLQRPKLHARNRSGLGSRVAVGTIDEGGMNPFLLLESSLFGEGSEYQAEGELYLHVFRSNGYTAGKYGDAIAKAIEGDRLTPEDGIRIQGLRPLTSWHIRSAGNGKLKLEVVANRKEDVKKYKHECKITKAAKAPKSG